MGKTIQAEMRQKKQAEIEARAAAGLGAPEPSPEEVSFARPLRTKPSCRFSYLGPSSRTPLRPQVADVQRQTFYPCPALKCCGGFLG